MNAPRRIFLLVSLLLLATSSCDCEQRVRGLFRGSTDSKKEAERAEKRRAAGESSAPREQEPNDTPEEANEFALGSDMRPIRAEINSPDDRDWFAFSTQDGEDSQVTMTVTPRSSNLDLVLRLEVPGSPDAPLEYHLEGAGEPESIPVLALSKTPQRVMIFGANQSTGEYEISFQKRLSGGNIEAEPNDDIEAATRFEAPGSIEGFYDRPDDRDIFFIPGELLQDEVYQVELTAVPGLVQRARFYTQRDFSSPHFSLQVGPDAPGGLPNLHVPKGIEGLWVVLSAGEKYSREHSYRLSILAHPPAKGEVEVEPNDSAETAQKLALGARLSGYFHVPEDVDYFRIYAGEIPDESADPLDELEEEEDEEESAVAEDIADIVEEKDDAESAEELLEDELPAGEPVDPLERVADKDPPEPMLRAEVKPLHEELAVAIAATPSQGSRVSTSADPGERAVLCNLPFKGDYLDVQVRPAGEDELEPSEGFDYELLSEDTSKLPGIEVEPNDSAEDADKLLAGEKRVGFLSSSSDIDVFAIGVPFPEPEADASEASEEAGDSADRPPMGGSPLMPAGDSAAPRSVEILLGPNPANLAFELRDDEGGAVAKVDRAGPGGEERLKIDLPPGLYFIHVSGTQTDACMPYEISYTLD